MTENNLWHSKEEKPEVNSRVLYINHLGAKHLCTFGRTNFIEEGRDINKAEKWCYIDDLLSLEQQLQAKEEEIVELKDFVGYCFDLQLRGCSDNEKYEGIKNRADEILKGHENK